jgi:prepilin-type N-terminal cleavage/methylation domain-containing protein
MIRLANDRRLDATVLRGSPGFTLIELAIVLFVVTLLLGGVLTPLGQQIAERQASDTRRTMEHARTALIGYALGRREANTPGYLPCPDMRTPGRAGVANDGQEDRHSDGSCAAATGNLPWITLGLAETDAWGNRLGYAVAAEWSRRDRSAVFGPAAASPLQVCHDLRCESPMPAAAVLVSHGRNGFGATNAGGGINLAPTAREELGNLGGDGRYYMHPPRAADRPGGEFDDMVLPVSPDWLRGRLCDPASLCAPAR